MTNDPDFGPEFKLPRGTPSAMIAAAVMALAVAIVAGLFLLEIPGGNRDVAMVVLGVAIGWAGTVVNFHFGSSHGSQRKTDILAQAGKDDSP